MPHLQDGLPPNTACQSCPRHIVDCLNMCYILYATSSGLFYSLSLKAARVCLPVECTQPDDACPQTAQQAYSPRHRVWHDSAEAWQHAGKLSISTTSLGHLSIKSFKWLPSANFFLFPSQTAQFSNVWFVLGPKNLLVALSGSSQLSRYRIL